MLPDNQHLVDTAGDTASCLRKWDSGQGGNVLGKQAGRDRNAEEVFSLNDKITGTVRFLWQMGKGDSQTVNQGHHLVHSQGVTFAHLPVNQGHHLEYWICGDYMNWMLGIQSFC